MSLELTRGESLVYTALLRLGSSKVAEIVKESRVSYSKVYDVLERLGLKGLVNHRTIDKIRYFQAVEPYRLYDYIERKEDDVRRQIKDQLQQTGELEGKLERMADFSLWGEAAARAMRYDPMEFLNAYSESLKNQSRDAVNFNALAEIMCAICQEELATEHTIEYTLPQLLANDMGIDIDRHSTKFAWAKTPQSLSEELMHISTLITSSDT
jgi:sugar-specific transcriptional regulator TrmB